MADGGGCTMPSVASDPLGFAQRVIQKKCHAARHPLDVDDAEEMARLAVAAVEAKHGEPVTATNEWKLLVKRAAENRAKE